MPEIEKARYRIFWRRAEELYKTSIYAYDESMFNASAITIIHCAISSNDAVTVALAGKRAERHEDAPKLLNGIPGCKEQAGRLTKLLSYKNRVEYEEFPVSRSDAEYLSKSGGRFYEWAQNVLKQR